MTSKRNAPYITEITLRDGEKLQFEPGQVVLLVGPNNAGKTYFLKALRALLYGEAPDRKDYKDSVLGGLKIDWLVRGVEGETMLLNQLERFRRDSHQFFELPSNEPLERSNLVSERDASTALQNSTDLGGFAGLFVSFDDVGDRLEETKPQRQSKPREHQSLVQKAWDNPGVFPDFASGFKRIFAEEISYFNPGWGEIGLLLAPPLETASTLSEPISTETKKHFETSPKLWEQGYGMRSVAGLLLRACAGDSSILLVDEPEACLHPPQASSLGTVLAEIAKRGDKQIFVATHDRNFIASMVRAPETPLKILKLERRDQVPKVFLLDAPSIRAAQHASAIRFTPFLDSLFADFTILVENERDAVFYDEALIEFAEQSEKPEIRSLPERVLFLSGSGFSRIPKLARSLRVLGAEVRIICDFDAIFNKNFQKLLEIVAESETVESIAGMIESVRTMDRESAEKFGGETSEKVWSKKYGMFSPNEKFNSAAERLLKTLDQIGIHVIDVGELENLFGQHPGRQKGDERLGRALNSGDYRGDAAQRQIRRLVENMPQ